MDPGALLWTWLALLSGTSASGAAAVSTRAGLARQAAPLPTGFLVVEQRVELARRAGGLPGSDLAACAKERWERTRNGLELRPVGPSTAESAWIELPAWETPPFRELLASWNARVPSGLGVVFEVRVAGADRAWSPWLHVGDWGAVPREVRALGFDGGRIDVDCFVGERTFTAAQLRARALRAPAADPTSPASGTTDEPVVLERYALCVSDRTATAERTTEAWRLGHPPFREEGTAAPGEPIPDLFHQWVQPGALSLDVPFRSQKVEDPSIASRICSPTSVAMVLAYRGVDVPTAEVARLCYDAEHGIYGNWTRAIQGAFTLDVPGYLTRFADWERVRSMLERGQPLVISLAAKEGELTGAPYAKTDGHLLVLRGLDEHGNGLVNDPAAPDAEHGRLTYARAELETCWLARGGTAYVLLPRPAPRAR